jgi:Chaperone of endosialidase
VDQVRNVQALQDRYFALQRANRNTAVGKDALFSNVVGQDNTAVGFQALFSNTSDSNTAVGSQALVSNTGFQNTALGDEAGFFITTGSFNIDIGNGGNASDSETMRIGQFQNATFIAGISGTNQGGPAAAVFINTTTGQLGTAAPASSRRYKKEIKPMDKVSEAILALNPVTFHYKSDKKDTPQFGLIAEEVAQVNPDLIVRDEKGEIYTVRYDAVNAMLLNEFLKEHRKVEEQQATIAQLTQDFQSKFAEQQKQIKVLTSGLEKVNNQLELNKPAPQMAANNQ